MMGYSKGLPNLNQPLDRAKAAYSRGEIGLAKSLCQEALQSDKTNIGAQVLLGLVLARTGDRSGAILNLRAAVRMDPQCSEAHVALCPLMFAEGKPDEAIRHGEAAIALDPKDVAGIHHFARQLIAHGRPKDAIPHLRMALALDPISPSLLQDLASAFTEVGLISEATVQWKRLTKFHPKLPLGWLKLGGIYLASNRLSEAAECGRKAMEIDPNLVEARIMMGLSLVEIGRAAEAENHLSIATKLRPDDMITHSALGLVLHELGRFDEAKASFEKTIELCPTHGQAYYSLVKSTRVLNSDRPLLDQIKNYLDHPVASNLDRSYMHYALGKANEDLGSYETAMYHFDRANECAYEAWFKGNPPDNRRYQEMIQATIETFDASAFPPASESDARAQRPLLVVGMIRSGTTLVEQILSSHPRVTGAGELSYWHDETGKVFDPGLRKVDGVALKKVGEKYLDLLERLGPDSARVTDKLPHNYTMLGFILAAIPSARVIHVRRNPLDNCLSMYMTAYQKPPSYTLSRDNILFGYLEYRRLMAHWKNVLPKTQLLEVDYEELISNREEITREMIEFAGLDWDESCLYHERNTRSVSTPSVWQVRQPIYKTSVERWKNYEPWLGSFRELLSVS